MAGATVEVRRSARRRRTVAAYREEDRIVVLIPARFTRAEEARWVAQMVAKLEQGSGRRPRAQRSDAGLATRARELSREYLDGRAVPAQIRWVPAMRTRWASCTPLDRTIRVSGRLREMPAWVLDYVLVHELAHLLEPGHGPGFWAWVNRYPRTERARGYLDGVAAAAGLHLDIDDTDIDDTDIDDTDVDDTGTGDPGTKDDGPGLGAGPGLNDRSAAPARPNRRPTPRGTATLFDL